MTAEPVIQEIWRLLQARREEMREHRRWLHQHAEISFQETETSRYIYEFYKKRNMPVKRQAHGNGMWVTIGGKNPGKHVALRADFDALPIQEETGLSFACTTGAMHACGHDAHTAYLMILAGCLWDTRERWNGTVRILHQPAEEMPPGGARAMIADGAL